MKARNNKSIMIGLRLTEEEFAKYEPVIAATGVSKSEFFRLLITGKFDPNVHNKIKKDNHREMLRLFNKASNNLNQIAKKINTEYRNGFISENTYLRYLNVLINIRDAFVRGVDKC
ncbi:TPA: plasmid mobilization relaxosome protein MobC [Salmonella enterica subsp. enterica serovar Paratyphi B]|nr:plasmid mobilization relaxosome protein MobC [Salmonella enterica]EDR7002803.1 plasmid mobilization relaxosome protein MobC [Salmonella enterica subsp. enterica serovar Java]EIU9113073.1 plasmid mobilization relaxosome protein MobC [Salmonella enterica]EJC3483619.1 plasmid mobilization relaxosome protein MobC [Salmonella enterica]EKZ3297835.1 plasmid mobilization relaxosome protein MobC [Salmonella enterica]